FATNFTNIKVGSYVAVRYRPVGQRNEAVNINLIELPLNPPVERPEAPATGTEPVSPTEVLPGERIPVPAPVREVPARPGEPVREPVVPAQPVVPAVPR